MLLYPLEVKENKDEMKELRERNLGEKRLTWVKKNDWYTHGAKSTILGGVFGIAGKVKHGPFHATDRRPGCRGHSQSSFLLM